MNRIQKTGRRFAAALLVMVMAVSAFTVNLATTRALALRNPRIASIEERESGTLRNPIIGSNGEVIWDCVYFGNYPQSDSTGKTKEPIKWRVLSVNGNDAFLVSDQYLDAKPYNTTCTSTTWETCTIRSWLNGYDSSNNTNGVDYSADNFIECAFSETEQNAILTTTLENADNPTYGTEGGNNTNDKVFLLSYDDVTNSAYGFSSDCNYDKARRWKNTNYIRAQKTGVGYGDGEKVCLRLRSLGYSSDTTMNVSIDGVVDQYGMFTVSVNYPVCPALHLNLSNSDVWSYAGTVCDSSVTGSTDVVTWDCVWFGYYPQSDSTGKTKEPIKWRVLSVNDNDAFLVADQCLDCQKYNNTNVAVTWETCTLRSWLNGYGSSNNINEINYKDDNFIKNAFSEVERNAILSTTLENADNLTYGTEGGNTTNDKIFLLSYDDMSNSMYGISSDYSSGNARIRTGTGYAAGKSGIYSPATVNTWWLRSPGCYSYNALRVITDGSIGLDGHRVSDYLAVCPALHLNLSNSDVWSYAGTVSSDGSVTQGEEPPSRNETTQADETTADVTTQADKTAEEVTTQADVTTTKEISPTTENSPETQELPSAVAAKGTILKDKASGVVYKVSSTSTQEPTVTCQKAIKRSSVEIVIPAVIVVNGVSYKVTAIAANAFKNNKNLTKVTIGKNVTKIGEKAFFGCKKLKKLTIQSQKLAAKGTGSKAFQGISSKAVVKVPKKNVKAYRKWLHKKGVPAKVKIR